MSKLSNKIKSLLSKFSSATIRAAMAEDPAVMQASGWDYDENNTLYQGDPNNPGAKELRKSLAVLGLGTTAANGAAVFVPVAPAALGNAVAKASSYLQPSKYIDSAVKALGSVSGSGLGASSYYTGASTLPGVLADTAADSYFAADAVRRIRNGGSPKDYVAGALDLAPLLAPVSKAFKLFGRSLGNIDAYKDLVKDDSFVIDRAYDGFNYAKDKYRRRGDLLRGHAESSFSDVPDYVYNSAILLDNDPYFTIKKRLFGNNGEATRDEIMLNKGAAEYIWAARKNPRAGLRLLQRDAAHEGTHWALGNLHDNLSMPGGGYYVANPEHPLYADYTSWFDTKNDSWLRSPDEFVADLTGAQYLNGMPADRSYRSFSASERLPVIKMLSKNWKGVTNSGIDSMIKNLSDYGYDEGGFLRDYKSGGKIHIKPSHRGKLTELKKRTGKSEAELYNDGNPAHKKMVVFARNARKWKHDDGGFMDQFSGYDPAMILEAIQKIKTAK